MIKAEEVEKQQGENNSDVNVNNVETTKSDLNKTIDKNDEEKNNDTVEKTQEKVVNEESTTNNEIDNSNNSVNKNDQVQNNKEVDSKKAEQTKEEEANNILGELTDVSVKTNTSDIEWKNNKKRKLLNKVLPEIPDSLKKLMGDYTIRVYIEVNKFGIVSYIEIVQSSGITELDSIVYDAISKWTFEVVSDDSEYSGYVNFSISFK